MPTVSTVSDPTTATLRRGVEVTTQDGRSLPLVSARLHGEARGGVARLVLEQRFVNPHAETLAVTYRMPLPADGAVSGYAFTIAGRTIRGRVEPRRAARARFEQAIASGLTAALLEQDRADIFTQEIGNLPAGEELSAWIAVDLRLTWLPEGAWELRFPTVIGPRYLGADATPADAQATAVTTLAEGVAPRLQIELQLADALTPGGAPSSPSHALTVGAGGSVKLRGVAGAALDRDLVVRWPVAGPTVGMTVALARPAGDDHAPTFGLLTIVPPQAAARADAIARDLILLVDTSGSMAGRPLEKAKQVLALLIESLGDADRLELIEFSNAPRRYRPRPVAATREEKRAAIAWLRGLAAGGGTEMRTAVIEAMRALRPDAQRQVVLATDGYIGGEEQLVRQLLAELPRGCRLHFVGVGSAVNRSLATSLARAGRGAEVVCDLDEDAERAAGRIIARTRQPILTEVEVSGSAVIERATAQLPDVYAGAPCVTALQLGPGELVVRGARASGSWEQRITVGPPAPGAGNQAIRALFARERVAELEARSTSGESVDDELERLGVTYQLATRKTSWIAIDEARFVDGPARREEIPQALPYGTTAAAFGLRAPGGPPPAGAPGGPPQAAFVAMPSQTAMPPPPGAFDDLMRKKFEPLEEMLAFSEAPAPRTQKETLEGAAPRAANVRARSRTVMGLGAAEAERPEAASVAPVSLAPVRHEARPSAPTRSPARWRWLAALLLLALIGALISLLWWLER